MQINHLTQRDVQQLTTTLDEMKNINDAIEYNTYIDYIVSDRELLQSILQKVVALENKVNLIFGNSCLINGKFVDVTKITGDK